MNLSQWIGFKPIKPKLIDVCTSVFSSKNFILLVALCFTIVMQLALEGKATSETQLAQSFSCSTKYCTKMRSCKEAVFHFKQCNQPDRDRDNDGIPCEVVCGKTLDEMRRILQKERG